MIPKLSSFDYKREANFDVDEDGEVIEVREPTGTSVKRIVDDNKVTAKGVIKSVKDAHLRHEHYVTTLHGLTIVSVSQNIIKSKQNQLQNVNMKKVALSALDTKRWLLDGGVHNRAHGHYKTKI